MKNILVCNCYIKERSNPDIMHSMVNKDAKG